MSHLNFEKNLEHQSQAVESILKAFKGVIAEAPKGQNSSYLNPRLPQDNIYATNIKAHSIQHNGSNILDIMMETGTGKTYTYTKTMFELNRRFGIFKFIIIVPTLSIKAGTISFLNSVGIRQHFKEEYGKIIELYLLESQKKPSKQRTPMVVGNFVKAESFAKQSIQVLIINAGMLNSNILTKSFDQDLFDKAAVAFDALALVRPFVIIDEPHKFKEGKKTWENIQKLNAQYILRYGATFPEKEITLKTLDILGKKKQVKHKQKDYHNLMYELRALDAFNQNLVKGVIGHITTVSDNNLKQTWLRLLDLDGKEAFFEVIENATTKKKYKVAKGDSLGRIHPEMHSLSVENMNKSILLLSNGLELRRGDKINPYSYATTLQEMMLRKAINEHFKIEKQFLTREVKIKPLTLFFIDNIEEYRGKNGFFKTTIETLIETAIKELLKTEEPGFYRDYLARSLKKISATHGGYFSKDNSDKDENIEREVSEILHDKQVLLSLDNPRRFIFSKWTLREGWDNPNVFQICKLRSSGSEISKLQEVGRGLRLPVNQYGNRVKDEQFYLNYFVDFTEQDFIDKLINEINQRSEAIAFVENQSKLDEKMIAKICEVYSLTETALLEHLDHNNVITRANDFKENGLNYIKEHYPCIFDGVGTDKIRISTQTKPKIIVRTEKYNELKALWEKLNEKVILEYKFKDENHFQNLLSEYFKSEEASFVQNIISNERLVMELADEEAYSLSASALDDGLFLELSTMNYSEFLQELGKALLVNMHTLHRSLVASKLEINKYMNLGTIRQLKDGFNQFLLRTSMAKFEISYQRVATGIHPSKFTNEQGEVLQEVSSSDIGIYRSAEKVANNYFLEELFYDSKLEEQNIKEHIAEVVVFTKIPKNSIKIPVAGGKSYTPDFAYVLNYNNGQKKLNFVIETKNVESSTGLRLEEEQKIAHAKQFFGNAVEIHFRTQWENQYIRKIIDEIQPINTNYSR